MVFSTLEVGLVLSEKVTVTLALFDHRLERKVAISNSTSFLKWGIDNDIFDSII